MKSKEINIETNEVKKQQIVQVALKRFSHFGINKTTMSEIAEDISVSKANLYYYFPDKTALVIGVIMQLITEGKEALNQILHQSDHILDTLIGFLKLKTDFFEKHYLLHVTMGHADSNLNMAEINTLGKYAEEMELEALQQAFTKAIANNQLVTFDVTQTSQIYFTILKGIAMVAIAKIANKDIPENSIFREIFEKQKIATTIFINGLRHHK
ncbi:hypothetical protein GCM10023231_10600 [Olivibacter ginsenosidimutans]|uniref:HTH tetR-type domain-containing protein n=1 Tax=Olivibacter ginsenosidimutans TaxID=1176537 RepID=A0ABP9ATD9_9SPHI